MESSKGRVPEATVQFCHWHVMKTILKKMVECDTKRSKIDEVQDLIHRLVYSKDANIYSKKCVVEQINSFVNTLRKTGIGVRRYICGLLTSEIIMCSLCSVCSLPFLEKFVYVNARYQHV